MKFITTFLLLFLFFSDTLAQDYTSPNLIGNGYSTPTGVVNYTGTGQGYSGGSTPGFNSTNNTIYFGYTQSQVAYTYAFSQALQNSGMTILGYNYSWSYLNEGYSGGNLSAIVNFASINGTSLHSKSWTLGTTSGWTNISGTETFTSPGLSAANISNFTLKFNGKDNRFWAGYYGPQVRDPSLSLNYTFDACSTDPLSSPSCPGYAAALLSQQCSINALYDPSCPGYATAYMTQQCSVNALYDPSCPGYAAAYFTQQCNLNPLYNSACPGYAEAYKTQQCNLNPLYDSSCPGYAAAYKTQQCNLNGLYATDCPNYAEAYAKKNILGVGTTTTTTTTSTTTVSTTEPTVQVRSDGKVDSTSVPLVKDSNVNNVITSTTTSATPSATAAVPLVSTTPQQGATNASVQTSTQTTAPASSPRQETAANSGARPTEGKTDSKANQQQMKANANEKAKEEMKKASSAPTMEAQIATQGAVLGMMSFVPGFDSYQTATIIDVNALRVQRLYGKDVVENRFVNRRLFGGSDRLHQEMVDQQYQLGR